MADHGYVLLTAQNVTDGTVTVTPAATPVQGIASVQFDSTLFSQLMATKEPRPVIVSGSTLVVTLNYRDKVGRLLRWTSYE